MFEAWCSPCSSRCWLQAATAKPPVFFKTPLSAAEMAHKQAVVETSAGRFVIDLNPELAPNHVGYFMKLAKDGTYNGTIFHRLIKYGIVQGGDPLSKDPAKAKLYGTGGLGVLKAEMSGEKMSRGAVAAVLQPGKPDSAGSQFFVCVTDQPALDGKYTVFGHVSEGMDVVQKISETPATPTVCRASGSRSPRSPFATRRRPSRCRSPRTRRSSCRSIARCSRPVPARSPSSCSGPRRPEHVRNFLRLAAAGVYSGTGFHRVVKGFAIQTGALTSRGPLTEKQQALVHNLQPEFNDTKHVKGIISMARGDDPASATTSFFIVTGDAPSLDGKYTAFGRVIDGQAVADTIEQTPVNGETPVQRIELKSVAIVK